MSRSPCEIWTSIFTNLSPRDLLNARRVCRAWKSLCEETLTKKVLSITSSNHLEKDGQADFQRILQDYSILLRFPYIEPTASPQGATRTYFTIDYDKSGRVRLVHGAENPQPYEYCKNFGWAVLDCETSLENAKRVLLVGIMPPGDALFIILFERGRLEDGLNILTNWPIVKQAKVPLGSQPCASAAICGMDYGLHTVVLSVTLGSLKTMYILFDVGVRKVLTFQSSDERFYLCVHQRHGWLAWESREVHYGVGTPSRIFNFKDLDGYWLVSYWQYAIENGLVWRLMPDKTSCLCPLDTPQMFLYDGRKILKVDKVPGLSFNDYYLQHAFSSGSSAINAPDHRSSARVVRMSLPSKVRIVNSSALGDSLPEHLRRCDWRHHCYFVYKKPYILFHGNKGPAQKTYVIVDLSRRGLDSILSRKNHIAYRLTAYNDSCMNIFPGQHFGCPLPDVWEDCYETRSAKPKEFMFVGKLSLLKQNGVRAAA